MLKYVDTHCHLSSDRFVDDADAVIRACLASGVQMLAVAADVPSSRLGVRLAEAHRGVLAAVGVHPNDAAPLSEADWAEIERLARHPLTAAIGETGLDYYWKDTPPEVQKMWFERHIELAMQLKKPLVVHARDSVRDVLDMLRPHLANGLKAVWHCFVASKKDIGPALDFAIANRLHLAVGGLATYEDQKPLRARVPLIPDDLLLLETDSPYLSPSPKKSLRNNPTGVIRVAEVVAELRGTTPDEIAAITTQNAVKLFGFSNE